MRTVIEMAREAGVEFTYDPTETPPKTFVECWMEELERFAELIRADERDVCEALHDHEDVMAPVGNSAWGETYQEGWAAGTAAYLEAIRARSNT